MSSVYSSPDMFEEELLDPAKEGQEWDDISGEEFDPKLVEEACK